MMSAARMRKATRQTARDIPRVRMLGLALLSATALAGCASKKYVPPEIRYDDAVPALQTVDPPGPVKVVELPKPLPLPGQLKPVEISRAKPEPADPRQRISQANEAARMQPVRDGFINAIQLYPWSEGALYQIYAAPGQVTDIALQPGEQLVGSGPVAAGDTVRWIIGDTQSGAGERLQVHILVKPTRADLQTNLVINSDRRTYHLELRSTEKTYMASVSWQYPQDQLIALRRQNAQASAAQPVAAGPTSRSSTSAIASRVMRHPGSRCVRSTTAQRSISSSRRALARERCRRCSSSARQGAPSWSTTAPGRITMSWTACSPRPN